MAKRSIHKMDARLEMASPAAHGTLRRCQKAGPKPAQDKHRKRYLKTKFKPTQIAASGAA